MKKGKANFFHSRMVLLLFVSRVLIVHGFVVLNYEDSVSVEISLFFTGRISVIGKGIGIESPARVNRGFAGARKASPYRLDVSDRFLAPS